MEIVAGELDGASLKSPAMVVGMQVALMAEVSWCDGGDFTDGADGEILRAKQVLF